MKKNKWLTLVLVPVFVLSMMPSAWAEELEEVEEELPVIEDPEPETVYETIVIETIEDFLALAENCRLDTWSVGKMVLLQSDLSLQEVSFQPIPSFSGVFDGNGHTISGLTLTQSVTPTGLFGKIQPTGIVKNLTVSGTVAPSGDAKLAGGIAGENYGSIQGCSFTGSVNGTSEIGGIAGFNALTGSIEDCEANGLVMGSDMTGGIVGCNLGAIYSCVNKASVNTVSTDPAINPSDMNLDFLTDISQLTTLDISSAATDSGGIAGYSAGIVQECTNQTTVGYPHIGYNVGGIVGRNCGYVADCHNIAEIYGRKDVGGVVGQMEPYIAKNLTESTVAQLQRQLEELDALVDTALEHTDGVSAAVNSRLNSIAHAIDSAASAAQDIQATGAISSTVMGGGDSSLEGSLTITPAEGELGGGIQIGDGAISGEINGFVSNGLDAAASGSAGGILDAQTQISLNADLSDLGASLSGMAGQMSLLSGELGGASQELSEDIACIREKINEITETGFDAILGSDEDDILVDSSEIDVDQITTGKVYQCSNGAPICGDINVGGIAGAMGMEYALDPEEDLTVQLDRTTQKKYEIKAVIQQCKNTGTIQGKRNYVGGIAGKMDLGLITQCEAYGVISSESGDYIGGISGQCSATIRQCFAKCSLSGDKYIGGIVGAGVEETKTGTSSTVAGSYAMVTITEYQEYIGAISGIYAGTFLENYFVSDELAGINHMSYQNCAQPLTYDELLDRFSPQEQLVVETEDTEAEEALAEEEQIPEEETEKVLVTALELPEEFKKFELKFVIGEETVYSVMFDYGESFSSEIFPALPQKDGYDAHWDRTDLHELKFDTTVTAVYEPYQSALASENTRNADQSIFFVEGEFGTEDSLFVSAMALTPGAFDLPSGVWDTICKSVTDGKVNTAVVEQWQLEIPDDGLECHSVRYLPPDGDASHMRIYVKSTGNWTATQAQVIGSYVVFPVEGNSVQLAVVHSSNTWWSRLIVAGIVLAVLALLLKLVFSWMKKRPGKKNMLPTEQSCEPAPEEGNVSESAQSQEGKKKRWILPLVMILALLVGILGTVGYFLLPDLLSSVSAYETMKTYLSKDHTAMDLNVDVSVGDGSYTLLAQLDRMTYDGKTFTMISQNGRTLYYLDNTVYLENGTAYGIGDERPDYTHLAELALNLYEHIDAQEEDGTYLMKAQGSDAQAIVSMLMPSYVKYWPETDGLQIEMDTDGGAFSSLSFSGSGKLEDLQQKDYTLQATLTAVERKSREIPDAVKEAVERGGDKAREILSENLYRLLAGWQNLNENDPLAVNLSLRADCGILSVDEDLQLFRWMLEETPVYCVEKNGYALYYCDQTICNSSGTTIPSATVSHTGAVELMEILYTICEDGSFVCSNSGNQYCYTLSLDAEAMTRIACAIAPEAEKLNISFGTGSVCVVLEEENIQEISLSLTGTAKLVLSSVDAAFEAVLEFPAECSDAVLPNAVKNALK